jgi:DnaJ-domain-containing protein 1
MNPNHTILPQLENETVSQLRNANEQLQAALDSRIVIEQAKGVLAERYSLSIDEAFALLRYSARASRTGLQSLARAVVSERATPAAVLAGLARTERWAGRNGLAPASA